MSICEYFVDSFSLSPPLLDLLTNPSFRVRGILTGKSLASLTVVRTPSEAQPSSAIFQRYVRESHLYATKTSLIRRSEYDRFGPGTVCRDGRISTSKTTAHAVSLSRRISGLRWLGGSRTVHGTGPNDRRSSTTPAGSLAMLSHQEPRSHRHSTRCARNDSLRLAAIPLYRGDSKSRNREEPRGSFSSYSVLLHRVRTCEYGAECDALYRARPSRRLPDSTVAILNWRRCRPRAVPLRP